MKGLVLAGGKGSRLRPITHTSAKQLVPIANKPILFYVIENLVNAGIKEIGMIVGDTKQEIMEACGDGEKFGAKITYIPQDAPLGLAHAVLTAEDFIKDETFVMFLGDNFIKGGVKDFVDQYKREKPNSLILLTEVKNPSDFGVAVLKDGKVHKLEEKPKKPLSNLALVGVYLFDKNIFTAAKKIKPSGRGELEITDAIQKLIDDDFIVHPHIVRGWWKDTGKLEDILEANRMVLEAIEPENLGKIKDSQIEGRVCIKKGAEITNSLIRGPVIIGENTKIIDSYVGPFTSIYYDAKVEKSEIENSIVLEGSHIIDIGCRLESSLIGKDVKIYKSNIKPRAIKLMIGDHGQVGLV